MFPHNRFKTRWSIRSFTDVVSVLSLATFIIHHFQSTTRQKWAEWKRIMGTDGLMVTVVATSLCSDLLQLKKKPFAWRSWCCKADDTVTSPINTVSSFSHEPFESDHDHLMVEHTKAESPDSSSAALVWLSGVHVLSYLLRGWYLLRWNGLQLWPE